MVPVAIVPVLQLSVTAEAPDPEAGVQAAAQTVPVVGQRPEAQSPFTAQLARHTFALLVVLQELDPAH